MSFGTPDRPILALIHGWGLGSSVWQPVGELLGQNHDIQLIDLPGYARGDLASPTDFRQAAKAIADELPNGTIVCGWSLGAMLALQIALLAPHVIKGLVLVGGTPCFAQRADWPHAQPTALVDSFSQAVKHDAMQTRQRFVALLNQGDTAARTLTRNMTRSLATDYLPDRETLLTGLGWLRDVDLRDEVSTLAVPTLIIHGQHDPLMPLPAAQWLHERMANSGLDIFPGAAHAPFAHDPERFAARLDAFCDEMHVTCSHFRAIGAGADHTAAADHVIELLAVVEAVLVMDIAR
ncbi:MAG: alpha/beta fold hydrolase [Propionivibrio sp.]